MAYPLVSVLTNTYNRSDLIHRCIESIEHQTYQNYEHIIVDGNSTDDTEDVVKSYNDPHIVYIKLNERGPEIQMRAGFNVSKGKYVTFLDDDDEYLPEKLEKQVAFFENSPDDIGLIYCWMTYYNNNNPNKPISIHNPKYKGDVADISVSDAIICGTPTMMVRRDVFDKAGGTFDDSSGKIGSDWELFARVCQLCKVDYIPESLIKVYVHHGHARLSTDFYNEQAKKDIMFHEKFLKNFQENFIRHPEFRRIHYYMMCLGYATLGDKQTAWQYYSRMLRSKPSLKCLLRPLIKLFINK